jgi:hypothetical protein
MVGGCIVNIYGLRRCTLSDEQIGNDLNEQRRSYQRHHLDHRISKRSQK